MRRSIIIGIAVFSGLLLLTQYITYQRYLILKEAERQSVMRELEVVEDRLNASISHSLSAVKTLAFIVSEYGVPRNFDSVASNILHSAQDIDALQLTQKGVITHTYPLKGNEAAMGFDILGDSATRYEANRAIETRALFFAGPFELKQGGLGIVGRFPIFQEDEFQGFAAVIIRLSTLLKAIGIDTTQQSAFNYQLSKTNTTTQEEDYFLSQSFDEDRGVSASIDVPAADWKIMVEAKSQQRLFFNITFSIVGLLLSITGGVFAWYIVQQPEKLRQLVDKKTAQVIESQHQFRTTLERVSDGFISYDREWRYRYINTTAEHVLGLHTRDLIGKNIWEEFPNLTTQPIYNAYHKAMADQRYVFIESYLPDQEKWFENHLYPSKDGLSVFFRDITQQKKTEEDILRAYKEKESVLQRISDKVFSLDTEWRYTYLNDAALLEHSAGRKGTLGNVIWDVHPELRGTIFEDKYREAIKNMKTVAFESFYAPMKKWFAVKCYPSIDGLTVFYQDITDRKEKDKLIEINEARLVEAQAVANVGSWETDLATQQVIWSLQTYHIFELDPATFKPTHPTFLDFVHPHDRDKVDKAFSESFQRDGKCAIEHRIIAHKGQMKWVEECWSVFSDEKGKPFRAVGTCQDITERKKADHEMALLINNTEESFILMDRNLTIVSFNNQFFNLYKKYLGLTVQKGDSILAYAQPERKAAVEILYKKVLAGSTEKSEITVPVLQEEPKSFSIKYTPAKDDSDTIIGVFVTVTDITELKKAEELKEFERRDKEALINNTDDLIWSVTKDYKLIAANHAFLYSMHLSSNVMLKPGDSLMVHGIIPSATLAFWKDLYGQALSGKSFKREIPSLKSEEFWTETSFNPIFNGDQVEAIACYARNITERKKAEAILSASEVKYKKLFANNPAPMIIWDFETHQIVDCNEEALIKYEYTREEFLNLKIEDIRPEEDRLLIRQATETEETYGEIHKKIWRHKKKNGEIMFMDVTGHLIDYNNRRAALVMLIDVTEKLKTEEKIRKSELELRDAQKLAQLGSWNFDFEADRLTWSDELYNVFDTDHKTFQETHGSFIHLVDEQDREFVRQTSLRAQKDGTPFDIEYRITTAKGEKRVIHERGYAERNQEGKIIRLFGTAQNITESKKAEEQIRTEKLFSDSLINSLPGIFYLYDQDGRFTRWNKNFETISGYTAEEIRRMHPLDFYDEDEKLLMKKKIDTVFTHGREEITAHFYTKDKKKKPYYFSGHKILINGNSYLIGVGIDITERIQAEKELLVYTEEIKRLTAHLEQVREDERTRIAREVHDELGQQLTGLKMDASWLSKKIGKEQTVIHEKLSEMMSLMDHTIKTIRRISTDLRPGILDDLGLVAALEWQSAEFEEQYEIACVFKSEVGDLQTERQLATTVFRIYQEALTNVVRHAQASQVVSIFQRTETHLILTVQDNGQGFNEKQVKSKGTLGLIGMRERAFMVGAELSIMSKKGTGTMVTLQIPLALLSPPVV